jgi:hypothetical protein
VAAVRDVDLLSDPATNFKQHIFSSLESTAWTAISYALMQEPMEGGESRTTELSWSWSRTDTPFRSSREV